MKKFWALTPLLLFIQMPFLVADCENQMDRDKESSHHADGTYVGETVRLESSCFSDGDCIACSAGGNGGHTR